MRTKLIPLLFVILLAACGSERTRHNWIPVTPNPGPAPGNVTLALSKGDKNEAIRITATPSSGLTITEVVLWEVDGTLRASGGSQPVTGISGLKTNPLILETVLYGLSKFTGFSVRGTFVLSNGNRVVANATFSNVFPDSPKLLDVTSTVTSSPLPDRRTITFVFDLQALTGVVPPQRVNVLVEQVNQNGTRFQLANTQLGSGPNVVAQFTPSTAQAVRVTLTTPSGQTLQFASPLVLDFTQLQVGNTETRVSVPADVGL